MEALLNEISLPLIAVVVPIIIAGVKRIIPLIPKSLLPAVAGAVGPLLEYAITLIDGGSFTGVTGVAAGLAGVGLRELLVKLKAAMTTDAGEGSVRSSITATLLAAAMALMLTGCESLFPFSYGDFGQTGERGDDKNSAQKSLADRLLGVVSGPENRQARFALIAAAYSELATERVTRYDPGDAGDTLLRLGQMRVLINRFSGNWDPLFPETDFRHAALALSAAITDVSINRARRFAGNFIGGVNVAGLRERARVVAVQTALADSLVLDIRNNIELMKEDPNAASRITSAALARLSRNEQRIRTIFVGLIAA